MTRILDVHAHLWQGREEADVALLHRAAEVYGIEKILISGLGCYDPSESQVAQLNRTVGELCRRDSLFGGYVYVNPARPNALDVLRRGIEEDGMVGMKLWVAVLCDDPRCDVLYDYCGHHGVPVLVHTFEKTVGQLPGESTGMHLRRAACRHPNTQFIMAHLGGNCYLGLPPIRELPNVWVDFSGSTCRGDDLPYAISQVGSQRILFGTDMPGSFCMSYGQVLEGCTPAQQQEILWDNACRLFPGLGVS